MQKTAGLPQENPHDKETQPHSQDSGTSKRVSKIQQLINGADDTSFSHKVLDVIGEEGIKELEAITVFAQNDSSFMPIKPQIEKTTEVVF